MTRPSWLLGRSQRQIAREFNRHRSWITRFSIDGRAYGGSVDLSNDIRIAQFEMAFPGAKRLLELGSLEGGHTFEVARPPGRTVLGVEGREENVAKAETVRRVLGIENVRFIVGNLEGPLLDTLGFFDAILCIGLLYHLPAPSKLIDSFRRASDRVFIWTHYASDTDTADVEENGLSGCWYNEFGRADPLSGLSARSFWPTLPSLLGRLERNGFIVTVIDKEPAHEHGPAVTLAATAA